MLQPSQAPAAAVLEASPAGESVSSALEMKAAHRPWASSLKHSLFPWPDLSLQVHQPQEPPPLLQARLLGLGLKMEARPQPAPGLFPQLPPWASPFPRNQPFLPSPSWDPRSPRPHHVSRPALPLVLVLSRTRGSWARAIFWALMTSSSRRTRWWTEAWAPGAWLRVRGSDHRRNGGGGCPGGLGGE